MDSFISLAKQGYEAYSESQSNVSQTGGQQYNSPHHSGQDQNAPYSVDHDEVVRTAQHHGQGDSSLFSSALGYVNDNKHAHQQPLRDDEVQDAHAQAYHQGGGYNQEGAQGMSAQSMGSAAALKVLQQFTGGSQGGGGGQSQSQLISLAMAEASKLFNQSGGGASGSKQDAVNSAAMTVMKLLVQSKMGGGAIGGSNSGGLSSLMGMASKFM